MNIRIEEPVFAFIKQLSYDLVKKIPRTVNALYTTF